MYCSLFPVFLQYFSCLLLIFLIELVAGVLAYVYYQAVSELRHTFRQYCYKTKLKTNLHIAFMMDLVVELYPTGEMRHLTDDTAHCSISIFLFISLCLSLLSVSRSWVKSWSSTWARRWRRTMPNLEKRASLNLWTDYSRMWETPNPSMFLVLFTSVFCCEHKFQNDYIEHFI